jgi:hypothetical protein
MNYSKLSASVWDQLGVAGDAASGYHAEFINEKENEKSNILLFQDENKKLHFVIVADKISKKDILNPKVNGLNVNINRYKLENVGIKQFIDIECNLRAYIDEFTEIVREISEDILIRKESPIKAVNEIISSWKSFWTAQIRETISEEEQIGLICELIVLDNLCSINPFNALESWKGPLKEKYDFVFSKWAFEVKGTRREKHIHTIHGLDQLRPPDHKSLALISFLVSRTSNESKRSLQEYIEDIVFKYLLKKPELVTRFYELLVSCGYSKIHEHEYRKTRYDILEGRFYVVDENFPKLTTDSLAVPLNSRISEIKYNINLEGLHNKTYDSIALGEYFY